jgi:structural maintenance of chromosome 2
LTLKHFTWPLKPDVVLSSVEKKEAGLKQMLITVQKDKQKIEDTIVSLDNYKKEALAATWEKVNK